MRVVGWSWVVATAAVAAALALLAGTAHAQSQVGNCTLSGPGHSPYGAGYAQGFAYFCAGDTAGRVWKVTTNGPTATDCAEHSVIPISEICYDGRVSARGFGYWVLRTNPIIVAKSNGNGAGAITLAGEYTIPSSNGQVGNTLALDRVNQILYVGGVTSVYKLTSGGDSNALPSYQNKLDLISGDGRTIYGLVVDPATGYGYAGTASISANIIKFSLGANAADTMTRIGRIGAAAGVYGMGINLATGVIYVGFYSSPGSQMFLPGTGNNLPTSVGTFPGQIWTNTAFQVSTACNILYTALYDTPGQVLYNDMGNGTAVPTLVSTVTTSGDDLVAGAIDEHGFAYYTTGDIPAEVMKLSSPLVGPCAPPTEGGPITLTGTKLPQTHSAATKTPKPALAGRVLKVQFQLTRWNAAVPVVRMLKAGNSSKVWENYDLTIALPGAPAATLHGKPRVSPFIAKSKGPAVVNNTLVSWTNVPMLVNAAKKNYTRKFTVATKVAKTFVGNLTFGAVATGPNNAKRTFELVVPVVASRMK